MSRYEWTSQSEPKQEAVQVNVNSHGYLLRKAGLRRQFGVWYQDQIESRYKMIRYFDLLVAGSRDQYTAM